MLAYPGPLIYRDDKVYVRKLNQTGVLGTNVLLLNWSGLQCYCVFQGQGLEYEVYVIVPVSGIYATVS